MGKRKPKGIKKIDGVEIGIWFLISIIYVVIYMVVSGITQTAFDDVEYLGIVPIDIKSAIIALFITLWVPLSLLLKEAFKERKVRVHKKWWRSPTSFAASTVFLPLSNRNRWRNAPIVEKQSEEHNYEIQRIVKRN